MSASLLSLGREALLLLGHPGGEHLVAVGDHALVAAVLVLPLHVPHAGVGAARADALRNFICSNYVKIIQKYLFLSLTCTVPASWAGAG